MKRKISKEELERIYMSNTNNEAAEILGVSIVTLLSLVRRAGIPEKGRGYPNNYEII